MCACLPMVRRVLERPSLWRYSENYLLACSYIQCTAFLYCSYQPVKNCKIWYSVGVSVDFSSISLTQVLVRNSQMICLPYCIGSCWQPWSQSTCTTGAIPSSGGASVRPRLQHIGVCVGDLQWVCAWPAFHWSYTEARYQARARGSVCARTHTGGHLSTGGSQWGEKCILLTMWAQALICTVYVIC